jgi:predicted site-specific integrase-resolvase
MLLDLNTVSALLDVSPATVARWAKEGSLPCVILHEGKRKVTRRFRREDIARLMNPVQVTAGDAR